MIRIKRTKPAQALQWALGASVRAPGHLPGTLDAIAYGARPMAFAVDCNGDKWAAPLSQLEPVVPRSYRRTRAQ